MPHRAYLLAIVIAATLPISVFGIVKSEFSDKSVSPHADDKYVAALTPEEENKHSEEVSASLR